MTTIKYCSQCGTPVNTHTNFCTKCGAALEFKSSPTTETSKKSAVTTLLLCLFLGGLGIHRFYVGKIKTGILMLLTGGGLGIWTLVDLIQIACCNFTDSEGKYLIFTGSQPQTFKKTLIVIASIAGFILFYLILLISLVFYLTAPMTNIIKEQLSALHDNDIKKAYSYMANETRATVSLSDFNKYISTYPVITHYKNISIPERKFENNKGYALVKLKTENGSDTTVDYILTKENNTWKILGFRVNSSKAEITQDHTSLKLYQDDTDHYTIQYPGDWSFKRTGKHTTLFEGKPGTQSNFSFIIITVFTGESAKSYKNMETALDTLKNQIIKQRPDVKFLNSGDIELPTDPKNIHGKSFVCTYTIKGHPVKHMQFLLTREGSDVLYSWIYISLVKQYNNDLPVAKAMYESWKIE